MKYRVLIDSYSHVAYILKSTIILIVCRFVGVNIITRCSPVCHKVTKYGQVCLATRK